MNIKTGTENALSKDASPGRDSGPGACAGGGVAWITVVSDQAGNVSDFEVRRGFPGNSEIRTLDSGLRIDPSSLAFGRSETTLFWLNGRQARSDGCTLCIPLS